MEVKQLRSYLDDANNLAAEATTHSELCSLARNDLQTRAEGMQVG